ncbi:ABC transporter permease [Fulvivirgaceae bacterium PWU4]|uniref:ABC transporter permease n=1 Tax=Chryseosolibacter histidini TaxID=2782349 RepID=A0AAP2DJR0_9BACT|nr:ABC transporter permease [Chryseosolibacter histidini]MBT1697580.1 ABC transporter permease [Chryseosolibacter histidini]
MLKNYLKITLRNIGRYKTFSIINILGLTVGLTAFLGISLYITDEFSYDRFHSKIDRIYHVLTLPNGDEKDEKWAGVANKVGPTIAQEIPEAEKVARILYHNFGGDAFVSAGETRVVEKNLIWADPELLEILSIDLLKGKPGDVLKGANGVIISSAAARKYFGSEDPMGKVLLIDNKTELEVTGVFRDLPFHSRFDFQLIAPFQGSWAGRNNKQSWGNASFETLVLLQPGANAATVEKKMNVMIERNIPSEERWYALGLQALKDMHLYAADIQSDAGNAGDISQVKLLTGLSLIILIIASINYMNLSTAQSQRRQKEVGISKTLGASAVQLSRQFYTEASVFVLIAMVLSLTLFLVLLPVFNDLTYKHITDDFLYTAWFWAGFVSLWALLTLVSGSYPALYLSSFAPNKVLQRAATGSAGNVSVRKVLVVFQFTASVVLIAGTLVLYGQLEYVRNKKLGYQPEQVVAVSIGGADKKTQLEPLKLEYEKIPGVLKVALAQAFPGREASGRTMPSPGSNEERISISTNRAGAEVVDLLNIRLLAGTSLPVKAPGDTTTQVVLNKSAVDYLGMKPAEAVGEKIKIGGFQYPVEIAGVTEDFHFSSLHQPIGAYCFHNVPTESYNYLLVKVSAANLPATIARLEQTFVTAVPAAFDFVFLDQHMASLYQREQHLAKVILLFSGMAVFIACLGLYALASFMAEQRMKEIGIRKVLGASVTGIVGMLSRDFMRLVLIAFIIGAPLSYYLMSQWLESFTYRIEIGAGLYALSAFLIFAIAWITVGLESAKAAMANPVKSLKNE